MRFTISRGRLHPTFAAPIKLRNTPPSLRPTSCSVAFNRGSPATICYMRRSSRTIVWLNADSVKCFVEEICGFFRVSHVVIRLEERGRAEIAPVFSVLRYTAPVDPNCGAAIRIMIENQKHFARWIYVTIEISPALRYFPTNRLLLTLAGTQGGMSDTLMSFSASRVMSRIEGVGLIETTLGTNPFLSIQRVFH